MRYCFEISNKGIKLFIQNTTNNLLSIYKSGNMFRLIEPSSVQFTNHTEGTFSRRAHCGMPDVYKTYDNKRYKWLLTASISCY